MTPFRRVTTFLNIKPGEERLIGLLALLYFILAFGYVFVQSMAFGVFIAEYGVKGLPYSYITIAVIASVVAMLYIKLGRRVSFSRLLSINLIFLGCTTLLIWLALISPLYHYVAFILPLWFQIVVNLGNLAVWSLAGILFDFRQGKRLFPLISAGNWLGNIIGGLFIPVLVRSIGTSHLLLLASISLAAGLFIIQSITRSYLRQKSDGLETPQSQSEPRPVIPPARMLKNRYILLIFAYTILWWVSFFFVDNIFFDRASAQYPDADQLAAYIGQLVSMMGVVALFSSTLFTSRLIARFGLRVGLLGMPTAVFLSVIILAISGSMGASLFFVFLLISFAKLLNVAFGFSLSQSANAIVYQALPDQIRPRVQATAEGIVQPIAMGLAGLSLLALTTGLKFNYIGLAYVFIGLGAAWLTVIFLLSGKSYINALTQAITRRHLGDSGAVLADPASIGLLRSRLQDPHPEVVVYAMNHLEALDPQSLHHELPQLIYHPAPEVRHEAFARVEKQRLHSALQAVQAQLSRETHPSVKEAGLRALGAIADDSSLAFLKDTLNEIEPHTRRGALIGLLKYAKEPAAEQKLNEYLVSPSGADRVFAIEVLGQANRREYDAHLIQACDSLETSKAAGLALAAIGADVLPKIETVFTQPDAPKQRLLTLSRTLARIGGEPSQQILLSQMSAADGDIRSQILHTLNQSGYRTQDQAAIQRAVKVESAQAAWVCATQVDLGGADKTGLLNAALQQMFAQIRDRALMLLSFTFDGNSIRRVREALLEGSAAQVSYAQEIIDVQLPSEWKAWVMPLLEDLSPQDRMQRLAVSFPQSQQKPEERLSAILDDCLMPYWLRACAQHTLTHLHHLQNGDNAMLSTVEKVLILKTVSMFRQTPDNVLADVADLLEEVDISENETIVQRGDPGDSMYIIIDGEVRVHDGERLLNTLGERDVFGEMALLEPEPRIASVTAVEPTRLFRLAQDPFYELMADRPEVARGIIRVLTGHLRNRIHDIAQLNKRIVELESGGMTAVQI